jgi:hypothetical protein
MTDGFLLSLFLIDLMCIFHHSGVFLNFISFSHCWARSSAIYPPVPNSLAWLLSVTHHPSYFIKSRGVLLAFSRCTSTPAQSRYCMVVTFVYNPRLARKGPYDHRVRLWGALSLRLTRSFGVITTGGGECARGTEGGFRYVHGIDMIGTR